MSNQIKTSLNNLIPKDYTMKLHLLLLFVLLILVGESCAQRKRNPPQKKELTVLKNICCNYVPDRCLTLEAKNAIREDAYSLAREVKDSMDKEDILNKNFLEELTMLIYNMMIFIRINNSLDLQEINSLAIRKEGLEKNYKTKIEVEASKPFDHWTFMYIFSFEENREWIENSWEVSIAHCEYNFTVIKKGDHIIPNKIKLIASENAKLEIIQNCQ